MTENMIAEIKWGGRVGMPVADMAAALRCDRKTVAYHAAKPSRSVRKKAKGASKEISARRRVLLRLRNVRVVKGGLNLEKRKFNSCPKMAAELSRRGFPVCAETVRRDLHAAGIVPRVRRKRCRLAAGDPERRVVFAKREYKGPKAAKAAEKAGELFCDVAFSDEKIGNCNDHGARFEWVCPNLDEQASGKDQARWGPRVHVWGVIGVGRGGVYRKLVVLSGGMINAARYIRQCLRPTYRQLKRRGLRLMHDGAPAHSSRVTADFLSRNGVRAVEGWPPRSADLNPIENMWAALQMRVSDRSPETQQELEQAIEEEFYAISDEAVLKLVHSFNGRLESVIASGGKHVNSRASNTLAK